METEKTIEYRQDKKDGAETAIEVRDLCIRYRRRKPYSIKKHLLHFKYEKSNVFEAVKHVSFSVPKGNILGIVGRNGSGKSTLLKAIAGLFSPDCGQIDLKGNTVSLLSIGVGFQKELSGRENILLSGMLLGFSQKQILEKMDKIIKFADLGEFINAPVRTYSSGMYSRLAFSITAFLETDIMLIDEVLSVGDTKFKKKSLNKMKRLILDENRTALIVSHSSGMLEDLCDEVLWLDDGEIRMYGETREVLEAYEENEACGM